MIEQTISRVQTIIADQLDVNISQAEIDPDLNLFEEGLGLDSIAIVELVTLVEENFDLKFDEDDLDMEAFQNVRTLATHIQNQVGTNNS